MIADVETSISRIKRPHRKVRSGCTTCKRARVKVGDWKALNENDFFNHFSKCDEKRPCCTRCQRKRLECKYVNPPRRSPSLPDLPASDSLRDSESVDPKGLEDPVGKDPLCTTNVRDLGGIRDGELAKHYLTHTVQTFARGGMSDMWPIMVPAMALTCPVVRQGMLTLAAMCLHYHHHDDSSLEHSDEHHSDKYLEAAEARGKIFVQESRQKMQDFQEGLRTHDQDSILACSRLLCLLGFAFFRTHRRNGTRLSDPAAWTWLHLLRGVKTSYDAVVQAGRPVDEMFMPDMTTPQLCHHHHHQPVLRIDLGRQTPCFRYIHQSHGAFIDALRSALHSHWTSLEAERTKTDLAAAIDLLDHVTEQICSPQSPPNLLRTICTWPALIPKSFVDSLIGGSRPALVVYAHWLMLMVLVEELWWVDDMGRAGIREVVDICEEEEEEDDDECDVRGLLIWPMRMLSVGEGVC